MNGAGQTSEREAGRAVGRYVIYDQMAQGGTARVHLARLMGAQKFSRIVVMKGLKPVFASDAELRAMLRDEAWLAARIAHPNVVPVIDVEEDGEEFWLALEYVHGETLTGLMKALAGAPVPHAIAASIFSGVLHGLHAAHEVCDEHGTPLGIVHRDVSPQNIIVGVDGVARVLDFGIAKALGRSQATRDGEVKGKIAYMAPEQIFGEPVSRRTDVFAASIVLWEALAGKRLFLGVTESETIVRVGNMQVPPPSSMADVPAALDAVVLRGLARDPEKRFQTAREMALALEEACERAPASQVGGWVETLADATLRERRAMIQRIERGLHHSGEISVQPYAESSGSRRRDSTEPEKKRRGIVALSFLLVLLLGAGAFLFVMQRQGPPRALESTPAIVLKESTVKAEPPLPVVTPMPESDARAAKAEPDPLPAAEIVTEPEREASERGARRKSRRSKKDDACDPPYVIDAQGHKRFRVECL